MAIKFAEVFRQDPLRALDFTSGALDLADIFNQTIQPLNQLEADNEPDPFVEQANRDADAALSYVSPAPISQFGFESPTTQLDEIPATPAVSQPQAVAPLSTRPSSMSNLSSNPRPNAGGFDPAAFTFEREARRDSGGNLRVYTPPAGDGGGAYEVAGITARYQPQEASKLRSLIQQGRGAEAEEEAKSFFRRRAEPFTKFAQQPGLQLQIADSVHHRGEGGLRRILQRATGSDSKSYSELVSTLDSRPDALERFNKARVDYELQEVDRGRASRQKFRQGLLNRFAAANQAAIQANS